MNPINLWSEIDKTIHENSTVLWESEAKTDGYTRVYRGGKYIVAVETAEEAEALKDVIVVVCNRDEFLRHLLDKDRKEILDPYHPRMRTITLSEDDLTLRLSLKPVRLQKVRTPREMIEEDADQIRERISEIERRRDERFETHQKLMRSYGNMLVSESSEKKKLAQKYEATLEQDEEEDRQAFEREESEIKQLWRDHEAYQKHLAKHLDMTTQYIFSWYGRSCYYRVTYYSPEDDKRKQVNVGDLVIAIVGKDNVSKTEVIKVKSKRKPRKDKIDNESLLPDTRGSGFSVRPYTAPKRKTL